MAPSRSGKTVRVNRLEDQLAAVRTIGAALASAVGLDALLWQVVPQVSRVMRATRTTLFFYDEARQEIWSKVAQENESHEIRLKLGQGLAGWVAREGKPTLVEDAYDDPRFNREVDARTGFRTRSVAAVPLKDREGRLIGVLQVLNRRGGGAFTEADLELLTAIAAQASYAVENARLAEEILARNRELDVQRKRAEQRRAELDLLYQLEQETSATENIEELLDSIILRACEHLRSAAGSVFLLDRDNGQLFFRGVNDGPTEKLRKIKLALGEGIVGWVAERGEPVIVNRSSDDPRHSRSVGGQVSYDSRAVICVPLVWDRRIIGAVEVLDPAPRPSGSVEYDLEDLKMLTLIAGQVARAVWLTQERIARAQEDRMAVVGRMLAGVAHDLRNPMTVISGHAQLMAGENERPRREARCEKILAQIDEMTGMITDLLAFSRGESTLRAARIDVAQLASEIDDNLRTHCEPRGIKLQVSGSAGHAFVDLGRVKRIVYNVARNAIDVLKAGDDLKLEFSAGDQGLGIVIRDTGPGMDEQVRSRLFEPFFTYGKVNGTGLGLSIVKRFVDDHRGNLTVESEVGKGTTFAINLPNAR